MANRCVMLVLMMLAIACGMIPTVSSSNVRLLTDANFDQETAEGVWLVEFFAPWCSHCKDLQPTWEALADELQGQVNVAKVDGTSEKVLLSRFNVNGFPMIFHIHGSDTRQFAGKRTFVKLKEFALDGWAHTPKFPSWKSPTSRLGKISGQLHGLPVQVQRFYTYLHVEKQYSQATILASLLIAPLTIGLSMICMLDAYMTRRPYHPEQRTS